MKIFSKNRFNINKKRLLEVMLILLAASMVIALTQFPLVPQKVWNMRGRYTVSWGTTHLDFVTPNDTPFYLLPSQRDRLLWDAIHEINAELEEGGRFKSFEIIDEVSGVYDGVFVRGYTLVLYLEPGQEGLCNCLLFSIYRRW